VDRADWAELATDYGEAARRHLQICRGDEIYDRLARASRIALRIADGEIDEESLLNRLVTLEMHSELPKGEPGERLEVYSPQVRGLLREAFRQGVNWVEENCLGVWLHGRHWDAAREEAAKRWPSPETEPQNARAS